jgi:Tol biopolymer transport system component
MVRILALRTLQIWLMLLLLISTASMLGHDGIAPALQTLTQISCDDDKTALWDRQRRIAVPLTNNGYCILAAAWSPDGSSIAYSQHRMPTATGGMFPPELIIRPISGASGRMVHDGRLFLQERERFYETRIQWSPDGQWLLYVIRPGANDLRLWVVSADGSQIYDYSRYIRHEPAVLFWSADSQSIYLRMVEFDAASQRVHLVRLALVAQPEPIVMTDTPFNETVWVYPTPHGGEMLTFADDGLWLVNLDTGASHFLAATDRWEYVGSVNVRWSADRESLVLFGMYRDKRMVIQLVSRDGSAVHEFPLSAQDDEYRQWYITDVYLPHSIRVSSPDWAGIICELHLASEQMTCTVGRETRRFVAHPE